MKKKKISGKIKTRKNGKRGCSLVKIYQNFWRKK